jgi:hypothetical protein
MMQLITYADDKMTVSQDVCCESGLRLAGFDQAKEYGPQNFDEAFYETNKHILEAPCRNGGRGYWLFKPYFCAQALKLAKDGDFVIYSDSGIYFMKPIDPLIRIMDNSTGRNRDIFLFGNSHKHLHWCKMYAIVSMLNGQSKQIDNQEQAQASVIIFRAGAFTRQFVDEWLYWAQQPGMIDDSDTSRLAQNNTEFREHRHDQSLLTNLAIKYGVVLHWWPVQYGHHIRNKYPATDNYPQLFYHHRYRNEEYPANAKPFQHITQTIGK